MSGRRSGNAIRGPQSALTDYLASNNISAAQIRADYLRRQESAAANGESGESSAAGAAAALAESAAAEQAENEIAEGEEEEEEAAARRESEEQKKKRKRKENAAISKIKASKEFQRKKKRLRGEPGEDDEDGIAWDMYSKAKPLPGQLENCELCGKRFTVTPYSKSGPDGGLLCAKCSKEQEAEKKNKGGPKPKKENVAKDKRRQVQSDLLHGIVRDGAKTLQELCVEKVAANIYDVEDFGDLPTKLLDRLAQILSKNRVITSRTLELFLRPDYDTISIYDCGNLATEDYIKMFQIVPGVEKLRLYCAGQIKDEVLDFIIERKVPIRSLQFEAANLVSDNKWREFFTKAGSKLETLNLSWLDFAFDDETVEYLVNGCTNLKRLKLKKCFRIGNESLKFISRFQQLEHLSLHFIHSTNAEDLAAMISTLGPKLRTISLQGFPDADDTLLSAIHTHCKRLEKLRFTGNDMCTDVAFASLFSNWSSQNPPLRHVDLSSNRDVDYTRPDGPEGEAAIGLASAGFAALMEHSGAKLETLDISSCRHITAETFMDVFDGKKRQYPMLKDINLSFLTRVDTFIVTGLFRSCPAIKKLTVFGCFNLSDVLVPAGVALIGLPNAQEEIVLGGDRDFVATL